MLKYKLTRLDYTTYGNTKWGENVTHTNDGFGELCGPGWLHYYHHPELAVLLNSIHADIDNPILWECEAEGDHKDDCGLKGGCTKLTTLRVIPLPEITMEQRIEIAIRVLKLPELMENFLIGINGQKHGLMVQIDLHNQQEMLLLFPTITLHTLVAMPLLPLSTLPTIVPPIPSSMLPATSISTSSQS